MLFNEVMLTDVVIVEKGKDSRFTENFELDYFGNVQKPVKALRRQVRRRSSPRLLEYFSMAFKIRIAFTNWTTEKIVTLIKRDSETDQSKNQAWYRSNQTSYPKESKLFDFYHLAWIKGLEIPDFIRLLFGFYSKKGKNPEGFSKCRYLDASGMNAKFSSLITVLNDIQKSCCHRIIHFSFVLNCTG